MRGIIVEKFKDKEIPKPFLEAVFKKYDVRNVGFATVDKSEGLLSQFTNGAATVDTAMALQEALEGRGAVFMFGEYKDGTLESDFQPSILLSDEKDKRIVVGFLVGDYPGYDKNDSHTPEHHVASEYLFPKIDEYNNFLSNNVDKLVEQMNRKIPVQEIRNLIHGEGTVSLMFNNGKILHYFKTDKSREYPWGRVSDHLDWATDSVKAQTVAEKLAAAAKQAQPKSDDRSPSPQPAKPEPKAAKAIKFDNLFGGKEIPPHIGSKYPLYYPPDTVTAFRDVRKWMKNKGGYHASEAEIKARIGIFSKADLEKIRLEMASEQAKAEGSSKVIIPEKTAAEKLALAAKDTATKHVSTVREAVPYLSEDVMKALQPHLKKLKDSSGNILPVDPTKYQLLEKETPTFLQKNGLKGLSETFRWTYDDLVQMGQSTDEKGRNVGIYALALLIMDYRKGIVDAWQKQAPAVVTDEKSVAEKLREAAMRKAM